jgi:tetratricopeptide (TPR) repeat protein
MKSRLLMVTVALLISPLFVPARARAQKKDDASSSPTQAKRGDSSAHETEMSSSKDTRIDLSPPKDDAKNHPNSGVAITDSEDENSDVEEMHAWDPHRAAKDIEVGDYYFKRKNYRGALDRYKDALTYKPNDAVASFRLAECEEKIGRPSDAIQHYEAYLKILPEGPFAGDARKALERLKATASK